MYDELKDIFFLIGNVASILTLISFVLAYRYMKNKQDSGCRKNNSDMKKNSFNWIAVFLILFGLLLYGICIINEPIPQTAPDGSISNKWAVNVCTIIEGVCISLIAGAIVSMLVDLPSRLRDYEDSFLNMLSSDRYISLLDEQKLESLREKITTQLHKEVAPRMADGLIAIDQRICKLLRKPYYEYYRQHISCEKENNGYIQKTNQIEYKLINPYGEKLEREERIKIRSLVLNKDKTKDDILKDIHIKYSADGNKEEDVSAQISVREELHIGESQYYDTRVYIEKNGSNRPSNRAGIDVKFKDYLIVKITYTIIVPNIDTSFTKRLMYPAKSFRLDYLTKDDGIKLFGQVFGTEVKQADISVKSQEDNIISLESFDWLLPQNGAVIVMCKK